MIGAQQRHPPVPPTCAQQCCPPVPSSAAHLCCHQSCPAVAPVNA
ncbi:unnamed protein product [Staurois parvus]|uniref:Uncharacterized protein n=1 Tax=Staurois parvus TaxID=386267 RepID=A0ABN9C839_9NEOB|nr:unnamed protein product [Staurois parvus]